MTDSISDTSMAIVDSPAPTKPRRRAVLIAACLLLLLAVQAITSLTRKSVTTDEIMYIAAGYYYLRTGEFDYNATHPPLMKIISALPLLALDPELPHVDSSPRNWSLIKQWQYSRMFFYENRVDADRMLLYARLPVVLLAVLMGVYVLVWARDLYGDRAALFSLFLFSFSPNILAHARLATTDLGLAAFVFMSCFHLWRYVRRPNIWSVVFCGLFLGMAVASKGTAALLGPIFVCYALVLLIRGGDYGTWSAWPVIRRFAPARRRVRQFVSIAWAAVLMVVVSVLVINAAYGFPKMLRSPAGDRQVTVASGATDATLPAKSADAGKSARQEAASTGWRRFARLLMPSAFVTSVRFQTRESGTAGGVYFRGKTYGDGLWYAMIVSFLIKTPIPLLLLSLVGVMYLVRHFGGNHGESLLAIVVIVYLGFFSYLHNRIGLRYILPVFPCLHVLAVGPLVGVLSSGRHARWGAKRLLLGVCAAWYGIGAAFIHPHYLAYFNESIGGPSHGYRYFVDSNLDWGQDLENLKRYMDGHGIDRITLGFFGSADADYYGIKYDYLPSVGLAPTEPGQLWWYEPDAIKQPIHEPANKLVAVSATMLAGPWWMRGTNYEIYDRLRECEPVDSVGYSILLFDRSCLDRD